MNGRQRPWNGPNKMEIVLRDSALFRSSIEALKEFLPLVQLQISVEGIRINGMDTSHVGFVDYFLSKEDFLVLKVPSATVIGVNTSILYKTLAAVGNDELSLSMKEDKLVISYKNDKLSKKALYEITTLDMSEDILNIPEFTYDASVTCKTADIAGMMKEVGQFGDTLSFRLDENGFHVSADGDCGQVNQTLENTDDREMNLNDDVVQASFATKYILMIMKGGGSLSTTALVEFDSTRPLRASFTFGVEKGSRFVAYLAPKLMEE